MQTVTLVRPAGIEEEKTIFAIDFGPSVDVDEQ
jgi:hypothetical protein